MSWKTIVREGIKRTIQVFLVLLQIYTCTFTRAYTPSHSNPFSVTQAFHVFRSTLFIKQYFKHRKCKIFEQVSSKGNAADLSRRQPVCILARTLFVLRFTIVFLEISRRMQRLHIETSHDIFPIHFCFNVNNFSTQNYLSHMIQRPYSTY
jgi:hypothetical protein